jgi:hypothetical protein
LIIIDLFLFHGMDQVIQRWQELNYLLARLIGAQSVPR